MGERAPANRRTRWLIFVAALVLAASRAPHLLVEPRFWAEEGSIYYAAAQQSDSLLAWVHIPLHTAGYLLLAASVPATFAARLLPIEWAPFATTYAAFAVLATALALVAFGRSLLWNDPVRIGLASAAVLMAPSALGEVWLNSTNSQIYCGLISLCVLCEDLREASPRRIGLIVGLLLFCGLSGVYTSFLAFAFLWKLWRERSRGAAWALGAVAVTSAVQFGIFVELWLDASLHRSKFDANALDWVRSAVATFYHQFLVPLGLRPLVRLLGDPAALREGMAQASRDPGVLVVAALGAIGTLAAIGALVDRDVRSPRNGLALALASLVVLTTLSAKFGSTVGRYAVLSGITLLWLLLAYTRGDAGAARWRALASGALFGWALAVGASSYWRDEAFTCVGPCPRWPQEVARWRRDPSYEPQIWPVIVPVNRAQWRVELAAP